MCSKKKFFWSVMFVIFVSAIQVLVAAKNVIVMIGDGMGISSIGITKYYSQFVNERTTPLNIELVAEDGQIAILYTYSKSHLVPDSAAAGTAFACGIKTANGMVSVDETGQPVENLGEIALKVGKSVGLVTTCELVDATPAVFSAHSTDRRAGLKIGKEQLNKKINVLLGGGKMQYDLKKAAELGYKIVTTKSELKKVDIVKTSFLLGVFSPSNLNYYKKRKPEEPSLSDMIEVALKILSKDPDGFFLVVEGGRIDHACHANDLENMLGDMYEFDEAIGVVKKFIDGRKSNDTLLLVTADHATGGVALTKNEFEMPNYPKPSDLKVGRGVFWISKHHTGCPVVLIATGLGAEEVKGFKDNTFVHTVILEALKK